MNVYSRRDDIMSERILSYLLNKVIREMLGIHLYDLSRSGCAICTLCSFHNLRN